MKIVLHIGTNKTGTSSLQAFLALNRDNLAREGWVYPEAGRDGVAHHGLASAAAHGMNDLRQMVDDIMAEAQGHEGVILSSEALHDSPHVGRLAEAFSGHEVRIIVFLRDYLDYLSSWYREDVQSSGICCDFENYAILKRKTYVPILRRWAQHFDHDALYLRDYNRDKLLNRSSIDEVLRGILGLDSIEGWKTVGYENNPSVSGNLLFLKRVINNFVSREEAQSYGAEITDLAKLDPGFRGHMYIRPEFGDYIFQNQFADDMRMLNKEFGFSLAARGGGRDGARLPDLERLKTDYDLIMAECSAKSFRFGVTLSKFSPGFLGR
ncbi:hypothetical protein LA6_006168 (plasmid) [Marinibacterium anthonyi]|nr:hypothetical protein LA6_006168 [Marinibacterium anthonyi]